MSKAKILEELAERVKGGDSLAMDFASRMQRAKEQGFDTDTVYYHGTASDFDSFKPNSMVGSDVNYANTFAKMRGRERSEGANVIPVLINKGNQYEMIDYPEDTPYSMMRDQSDEALIADGYDSKKRYDGAITVFDPSNIRSTNAAFDPAKKDSSNLLADMGAGLAATGGLSSLLAQGGEPMPTGIAYAPKSETLGYLSNLLQRVETPIGYPFGGLADYINKFNYGDDIGYLDRLATIPDPTEVSKLFE